MSDQFKVFWIEPNGLERRWLRRWSMSACGAEFKTYCQAMHLLGDAPKDTTWAEHQDSDWPSCCEHCGKPFEEKDDHQMFDRAIYVRPDTGATFTLNDVPVGACWDAHWYAKHGEGKQGSGYNTGPDGRCLVVRLPDGHDWMIDSRCSNCTRKDDNDHFCWVRNGRPEDGTLHVDKNGNTCSAGAGSILTDKWHGFLHNGFLHT